VIAVVVYEVTKTKNSTTSTTTVPASSASLTVDKGLASSVNLHLRDLPSGWIQAVGSAPSISVTSSTGKATQKPAATAFATCLGVSAATVGQLFGNTPSTDETVASTSPVFEESADNTIEMQSAVNIVRSSANAKSDATVFTKPGFLGCFTTFQTASAAALVPGTTAKVQQVQIAAPSGGSAYGFITTFTVPTQGTRVVGDAYMFGGRIEATLQPSTHGPDVPSAPFNSAYNAMLGRISANVSK
jgi:plasmid maintenance system antidote protein VapI